MPAKLLRTSAARFVIAGALGVGTYYILLYVLTEYVGWWYIHSSVAALVVNYSITFVFQKLWTFRDKTHHVLTRQIGAYVVMIACFYVANIALLFILVDGVGLWYMAAQAVITVLLSVISFFLSRRLFTPRPPAH